MLSGSLKGGRFVDNDSATVNVAPGENVEPIFLLLGMLG